MKLSSTMKLALARPSRAERAPIPLVREMRTSFDKDDGISFDLLTVPSDPKSERYKRTYRLFRAGSPEATLKLRQDIADVINGLNITSGPHQYAIARKFLKDDALAFFESATTEVGPETSTNLRVVLDKLVEHLFPARALAEQKRYMRRYLKKPRPTKFRDFVNRVKEMNAKLAGFPPFQPNQQLPEDELLDLLESSIPKGWQEKNEFLGFDPLARGLKEFIAQCERYEALKKSDSEPEPATVATKKRKKRSDESTLTTLRMTNRKDPSAPPRKKKEKWCELHQTDKHDMSECMVMRDQARKLRANWLTHRDEQPRAKRAKKPRHRPRRPKKSEDLHAIVAAAVEKALADKKPEPVPESDPESDMDSDTSSEEENFATDIQEFSEFHLSDEEDNFQRLSGQE